MKRLPTTKQVKLWNRLVEEVFEHPRAEYSIFVMEMVKRRVLGIAKEEFKGSLKDHKKLGIKCLLFNRTTAIKPNAN